MSFSTLISLITILAGALIMAGSVRSGYRSYQFLKRFSDKEARKLQHLKMVHLVLMLFFMIGYLSVAFAIYTGTSQISELVVGLIFFFGAIFVLLGVYLHSAMATMLSNKIQLVQESRDELEIEQARLLEVNTQLAAEVKVRERTEVAARESETRLTKILDSLPIGVLIIDAHSLQIKDVNKLAESMIGVNRSDIVGDQCCQHICSSENHKCPLAGIGEQVIQDECVLTTAQGTELPVLKTLCRIELQGRPHFLEAILDISEKRLLETQLQRSQKMEALGTLAGSVAHDLNNILSSLVSYPELLLLDIEEEDPIRKPLKTIMRSGQKAAVIVQDLLTLARRNTVKNEVFNLYEVVIDYLESPEHERLVSYHPGVSFEFIPEGETFFVMGSSIHLGKTVMNLISNGAEALINSGSVLLRLELRYINSPLRGYDDILEGEYVVLTVLDDGVGINQGDLDRIFEPFYTNKVMGHSGTGLGMAVVWNTVQDHQGYIEVDSIQGEQTTFRLYFPATENKTNHDARAEGRVDFHGKGEKILVVDDMAEQREIAASILKRLGYDFVAVGSGEKAVEYLAENRVDLVLLDMIMEPGIDGLETYRRILEIRTEQPVVLVSGFAELDRVQEMRELGLQSQIEKPYTLSTLADSIYNTLNPTL